VQEDGARIEGRFARGRGLGVRRLALVAALAERARSLGAEIRAGAPVAATRLVPGGVRLEGEAGSLEARVVVAADGLRSPLRRAAGLDANERPGRFGLRQHFHKAPWSEFVEVHWSAGLEAYLTPVGAERVNVAFVWDPRAFTGEASVPAFLERFPELRERLRGAPADSTPRGLGPLAVGSRRRVADRLVLVGDAAGFLDGITGEGMAMAFRCAEALGGLLPRALAEGATARALAPYERTFRREYRRYRFLTQGLLTIARRPELRRAVIRGLAVLPGSFEALLRRVVAWGSS
jgi:flavin-dependent dehydrogenase